MEVEVLGGGGGMSVDTKKKEKKGGRTLYALPVAFPCPFGPSWAPLVCSVVSVAFSTRRALLFSCCRAAVGGVVLVPFRGRFEVPGASCGAFLH